MTQFATRPAVPNAYPMYAYDASAGYRKRVRAMTIVRFLSAAYLVAILAIWGLIGFASENWWVSHVLTYLPRIPYLLPAIGLGVAAIKFHRSSIWVNLASIALIVVPIMGIQLPLESSPTVINGHDMQFVSCNVQNHRPRFSKVLKEIGGINPSVIAMQESFHHHELLQKYFADWNEVHHGRLWIGSKHPISFIAHCTPKYTHRTCVIAAEVETSGGPILVFNVHLMTARHALSELNLKTAFTGEAAAAIETQTRNRGTEAWAAKKFIQEIAAERRIPHVIMGDFNTPSSSSLFEANWSTYANAFDVAGTGYGYTSPCADHRLWLDNTPWLRIDHILCSRDCAVQECRIGTGNGSDHRLISARVTIPSSQKSGVLTAPSKQP